MVGFCRLNTASIMDQLMATATAAGLSSERACLDFAGQMVDGVHIEVFEDLQILFDADRDSHR